MPHAYADDVWRGEDAYPTLYLDDVSDIPFLVNIAGVEEYQHRARVRAGDSDLFAVVTPLVEGYETYCRKVLNLGKPKLVLAENRRTPLAVVEACCHGAALRTIVTHARAAGGLLLHPYMSIESVWELARNVARDTRVAVTVIRPPPPVTWIANDKKSFSEIVEQTLGREWLVRTEVARTPRDMPRDMARYLVDIARSCERVGLKRTRCASAMGNAVLDASAVLSGDHRSGGWTAALYRVQRTMGRDEHTDVPRGPTHRRRASTLSSTRLRAQDFVHKALIGASFEDILQRVGDDLYDPETHRGRFVFYNVGPLARSGKLDVIALGATASEAEDALASGLVRRLTGI